MRKSTRKPSPCSPRTSSRSSSRSWANGPSSTPGTPSSNKPWSRNHQEHHHRFHTWMIESRTSNPLSISYRPRQPCTQCPASNPKISSSAAPKASSRTFCSS
uniref:(northern house mosquito) hypothetical protein n=1 Tax=Culex pipiens TaxID=7175 RepID=A0A8D8CP41_CULPI